MDKKYQVFISSTFKDLFDERKKVLDLLLMADCIPSGMEAFVATDEEQFNVIKKVIDLCDYYILIIGGRYGSINEATDRSYTEMEYDYAISKGVPVLVFSIDDSVELDPSKKETDAIKNGKLAEFKSRAMRNRLASLWKDSSDLVGKVAISIMRAKQEINRPGWQRGGEYDQNELLKQIIELKKQNDILQKQVSEYSINSIAEVDSELPFYGFKIKLHYTEIHYVFTSNTVTHEKDIETTLDELYKFISLRLTGRHEAQDFIDAVSAFVDGYYVDRQQALVVKNQYTQLGLIKSFVDKKGTEMIELTEKGIDTMNSLNALK
ncbi:MAG: hypothetical protein APF84_00290 [Gracilibacter sp. BRH_c7a]|nr:MAG: hypothetical protein APF84_00290 [Gracilibacter sp. BRH_c7a]